MLEISGLLNSVTDDEIGYQGLNQGHVPFWFAEIFDQERILVEALPGILSVVAKTRSSAVLEPAAKQTPLIGNSSAFERFFWGNSPSDFDEFCSRELEEEGEGIVLDLGGLSLRYSTRTYVEQCRPVIVVDRSLSQLKLARDKVTKDIGRLPANFVFLQADYRDLPFKDEEFAMVFALDALNRSSAVWELLSHCRRVLRKPGKLLMTSLVLNCRWPGDQRLEALYRKGKMMVEPRTQFDLSSRLMRHDSDLDINVKGNVAYVTQACHGAKTPEVGDWQAA